MRALFKSSEFWQCVVFLVWAVFQLAIVGLRILSAGDVGLVVGSLLLVGGTVSLLKAFISVVRWRLENPEGRTSLVGRIFVYSVGTLALTLQIVWFMFLSK